ncbi:MAG: hypothetical protein ACRCT2_14875, partial [Plesiomonas shigelloides]
MTTTVTTSPSFQPVRLPSETASQATEPKRGAEFSASPLRSVFSDEQRLQVAQDKIKLIQKAQSEIKPLESSLAKMIATDNPINRSLDSFLQTARDDRKININSLSRELQGLSAIELPLADTSRLALQQELQALPRTRISSNQGNEESQM